MRHQTLLGHANSSQHIKSLMAFVVQNLRYVARVMFMTQAVVYLLRQEVEFTNSHAQQ
jgi:hypothetical protein